MKRYTSYKKNYLQRVRPERRLYEDEEGKEVEEDTERDETGTRGKSEEVGTRTSLFFSLSA